jgi:hypothetical protein
MSTQILIENAAVPHVSTLTVADISDLKIQWEAADIKETSKGKPKAVVMGVPGVAFWNSYKRHARTRAVCKALGITTRRISKGQWEAVAWINKHTQGLFEIATGFAIPEVPAHADAPF